LIDTAIEKGELAINFPKPKLVIALSDRDPVRYGPDPGHTKPMGCKGDECPITVVEYSEFQCGFCAKVQPTIKKLLAKYKGKIRWIARDYPLPNHPRARPAAIAAHCAGNQGKYWFMYEKLFENQRALADTDFSRYAKEIGLNTEEYEKCYSSSEEVKALVETNVKSGGKLGVSGTPAIFINGQRISGAVPFEQFERTIESELKSAKKS
jgi:protein-disulfide isomerase